MQPVIAPETLSSAAGLVIYVVTLVAALMSFMITGRA